MIDIQLLKAEEKNLILFLTAVKQAPTTLILDKSWYNLCLDTNEHENTGHDASFEHAEMLVLDLLLELIRAYSRHLRDKLSNTLR